MLHLSGLISLLLNRRDKQGQRDVPNLPEPPSVTARRFRYDTVCYGSKAAFTCAPEVFGADHLVTGSDYPVLQDYEACKETFAYIERLGLAQANVDKILHHHAQALFGLQALRKERMSERDESFGFAPEDDVPIPYMQRIRDYYQGLGYGPPYRWAHYAEVPFQPLAKPLAQCRLALITTAAPYQAGKGDQGPGAPYNAAAKFYTVYSGDTAVDHDLRISHVAIDRAHTTAEDSNTWFPLPQLRRCAAAGRIGEVAPRFHGAPTNRSHRATIDQDCPELLARCRADKADGAILVAN